MSSTGGGKQRPKPATHLLGLLKLVVGSDGNSQQVLERIDERVTDRGDGRETSGQRDGGNGSDTVHERVDQDLFFNVQDGGAEDVAVREDLNDAHTVVERRNVQHVQQGGLGGTDLGTGGDDLNVVDDFNRTSSNLGGDRKRLEERRLSGFHTSVTGGDPDVDGGDGSRSSRSGDLVGDDDLSNVLQVTRGEDETNVSLEEGHELLEGGEVGQDASEGSSDHGVLAHQDDTLASEGESDLVQLVGRDIVDVDEEDRGCRLGVSTTISIPLPPHSR